MTMCTFDKYKNVIAVSNRNLCDRPFMAQLERVCQCHPKALILRDKDLTEKEYEALAEKVLELCSQYQVPCILHTYVDVAKKLSHPMIHLPLPVLEKYSNKLQNFQVVGCSVHSVEDALKAQKLGATYLTAGHIYSTDCKKGLPPRGLDFLEEVCRKVTIPVYAIGGIHMGTGQLEEVMDRGAKGGCIMSEMMRI